MGDKGMVIESTQLLQGKLAVETTICVSNCGIAEHVTALKRHLTRRVHTDHDVRVEATTEESREYFKLNSCER